MPIYEYACNACKKNFSVLQSVGATEKDTVCTECGSRKVRRLLSSFSCASAGGGFGGAAPAGGSGGT